MMISPVPGVSQETCLGDSWPFPRRAASKASKQRAQGHMDKGVRVGFGPQCKRQQVVILIKRDWTRMDEPYPMVYRKEAVPQGVGPDSLCDHLRKLTVTARPCQGNFLLVAIRPNDFGRYLFLSS